MSDQFSPEEMTRLRNILGQADESLNSSTWQPGEIDKIRSIMETSVNDKSFSEMSASIADKMTTFKPCVEKDAPDKINKKEYTEYKRYFNHRAMALANKDKHNLYSIIKHSAGKQFMKLLDTLDLTESASRSENPVFTIFEIMDKHFDDESEYVNARIIFHNMTQKKQEKHVEFINRVVIESKKCNFGTNEIEREVVSLIRVRAANVHVRHQAGAHDSTLEKIRHAASTVDMDETIWKQDNENIKSSNVNRVSDHKRKRRNSSSDSSSGDDTKQANMFYVREKRETHGGNKRQNFRSSGSSRNDQNFQRGRSNQSFRQCYRCGGNSHESKFCRFKDTTCSNCGKMGHLRRVCSSSSFRPPFQQKQEYSSSQRFPSHGNKRRFENRDEEVQKKERFERKGGEGSTSANVLSVSKVKDDANKISKSPSSSPEYRFEKE